MGVAWRYSSKVHRQGAKLQWGSGREVPKQNVTLLYKFNVSDGTVLSHLHVYVTHQSVLCRVGR